MSSLDCGLCLEIRQPALRLDYQTSGAPNTILPMSNRCRLILQNPHHWLLGYWKEYWRGVSQLTCLFAQSPTLKLQLIRCWSRPYMFWNEVLYSQAYILNAASYSRLAVNQKYLLWWAGELDSVYHGSLTGDTLDIFIITTIGCPSVWTDPGWVQWNSNLVYCK